MTDVYLDENLSEHVASALNFLCKGDFADIQVHSTKSVFGKGEKDEVIIPEIGKRNGILITRDFNINKTRLQYELCKKYNLGVFFITLPKGQNKHWEIVKVLIRNWEEVVDKIRKEKRPFAYRISVKGRMERLQ